jgi:phosphatidate cytidylyltransferase
MRNFIVRTITGILFAGSIVGSILAGKALFSALFFVVTALTLFEFYSLINKGGKANIAVVPATIAGLFLYVSVPLNIYFDGKWALGGLALYLFVFMIIAIGELFRQKENPLQNWAYFIMGQVYVVLPFVLLDVISINFNKYFLLALFALIWVYDSGAYIFGVTLGKHRLFERISPKKSWEGAIGGLLAACGVSLIFAHFLPSLQIIGWLGFAVLVVVAGTFGDLSESLMKRTLNIKDSGKILPGHGGMLDRFDSLLFAAPVIAAYLLLLL